MSLTNIALNSRSLNGVITISDGSAVLENGNLTCEDINSASLNTDNINTNLLNVTGKLECNSAGPYNIPTSISSVTGLLIGYGNVSNSGATDFLNFQSTYTSTQGGFRFWNKSATQTLTNLGIIDNTQTYFKSQLVGCLAETPLNPTSVVNKTYVDDNFVYKTGSVTENITGLKTFLSVPVCATNASTNNQLVNFSTLNGQSFVKPSFNNVWTGTNSFNSFLPTSTITASSANELVNFTCLNAQSFVKPSFNNVWTGTNSFNSFLPTSILTPSSDSQLITKIFADQKYIDFSTDQTLSATGVKRFSSIFTTGLNVTETLGGGGNRFYINVSSTSIQFVPVTNSNIFKFFVKNASANEIISLQTDYNNTTIGNNLVSNNLTSPSVTGTNNIYTNLSLDGGIINVGARGSNINIKCNLNIVESVYGTTPTKITTINQEGDSCRFTNNGSSNGDFIFEINESGTYNPLIINKTSVNIAGDALVSNNLILYDTSLVPPATPSSKNVIIGMVGNDLFFTPSFNTPSSSYNFKVSDSVSNLTTPLTIDSTNTTIANNLISNLQATFNNICPISNTTATLTNHLTTLGFNDGKYMNLTTAQTKSGSVNFLNQITFNGGSGGGTAIVCNNGLNANTFLNVTGNGTFSSSLISNNLTSPTTTTVNNIYTSLVSGGEINFGGTLGVNNFFGASTFNSISTFNLGCTFYGISTYFNSGTFSEIEQTTGSQLVIRNTTNDKNIILSTKSASTGQVDSLIINTTSCDILPSTLNLTSSSTINILTPNNTTGVINFLNTLTTATINFCSTAFTSVFNLNARLAHKQVQYMNEVKTISATSLTLVFPIEQTWMFTSTGSTTINITLPELTASHQAGFNYTILKTASNTNSVIFTCQGTNLIRGFNSITGVSSYTRLSGTNTTGIFFTAEVSAGNFVWFVF